MIDWSYERERNTDSIIPRRLQVSTIQLLFHQLMGKTNHNYGFRLGFIPTSFDVHLVKTKLTRLNFTDLKINFFVIILSLLINNKIKLKNSNKIDLGKSILIQSNSTICLVNYKNNLFKFFFNLK